MAAQFFIERIICLSTGLQHLFHPRAIGLRKTGGVRVPFVIPMLDQACPGGRAFPQQATILQPRLIVR